MTGHGRSLTDFQSEAGRLSPAQHAWLWKLAALFSPSLRQMVCHKSLCFPLNGKIPGCDK